MLLLCFEWCGILVWFSTLLAFFNRRRKRSWKSTTLSKQREQRSRGKREILFERFSLKFLKGNFSASKERNKHFAIIAHNIITEHII